jgi:hypothetical protein
MMKKKSHSKNRKKSKKNMKKEDVITKEVGTINGFAIIEKLKEEKKNIKVEKDEIKEAKGEIININISTTSDEQNEDFFKNWIIYENPFQKESRFLKLFKELKDKENNEKKEESEEQKNDKEKEKEEEIRLEKNEINDNSSGYDPSDENNSRKSIDYNINYYYEEKEKENEELYLNLNINDILSQKDKRSTIMIKNIPNKFNQEYILSIINQNFRGTFDVFVLPTDINKLKNFGYAFINFTSSYYIPYFYFLFNGKMWFGTNSQKICELAFSKVQGKKALLEHYPNKIVFCNEEALEVTSEQRYIIPNIYKLYFNECFPKEKIEEFKYYFITKMPN